MATTTMDNTREIPLSRGQVAIVDATDYEWLSQWKWCALLSPGRQRFYAVRNSPRSQGHRMIYMHREILGLPYGDPRMADHVVPENTLDNRRSNLRIVTGPQNNCNRRSQSNNTSGFKGVTFVRARSKWQAQIGVNGKNINLGHFSTPEEAHRVYCDASIRYHGEFGRTA